MSDAFKLLKHPGGGRISIICNCGARVDNKGPKKDATKQARSDGWWKPPGNFGYQRCPSCRP